MDFKEFNETFAKYTTPDPMTSKLTIETKPDGGTIFKTDAGDGALIGAIITGIAGAICGIAAATKK
jgi:hypothetical protein